MSKEDEISAAGAGAHRMIGQRPVCLRVVWPGREFGCGILQGKTQCPSSGAGVGPDQIPGCFQGTWDPMFWCSGWMLKRWQSSPNRCSTCTSLLVDSCARSRNPLNPMQVRAQARHKKDGALLEMANGDAFGCCATTNPIKPREGRASRQASSTGVFLFEKHAIGRTGWGACPSPRLESLGQWRPRMRASLRRDRQPDWPMMAWAGGKAGLPNEAKLPAEGSGLKAARPVDLLSALSWAGNLKLKSISGCLGVDVNVITELDTHATVPVPCWFLPFLPAASCPACLCKFDLSRRR